MFFRDILKSEIAEFPDNNHGNNSKIEPNAVYPNFPQFY